MDTYWAWEYGTGDKKNAIELVRAADAQRAIDDLKAQLAALTTAHQSWTEVLGEWLWNCTNLLGDYNIKTVEDFNIELNRRVIWLMNNLEHTLTPPVTREEQQQIQDLTHANARLLAAIDEGLTGTDINLAVRTVEEMYADNAALRLKVQELEAWYEANEALQPKRGWRNESS